MHCSSFSRCLAPGYRIAWAAARRYAPSVQWLKTMSSIAASLPPQLAIAEYLALDGYDSNLLGLREALSRQLQHALRMVERHFPAGIRVTRPQGWLLPLGRTADRRRHCGLAPNGAGRPLHLDRPGRAVHRRSALCAPRALERLLCRKRRPTLRRRASGAGATGGSRSRAVEISQARRRHSRHQTGYALGVSMDSQPEPL